MLALLCLCSAGSASAGSLSITPVRLNLSAGRTAGVLTLVNHDSEPTLVQVDVSRWFQINGADTLEPTRELLATPPIFTVPAGGSQIVRVGLRGAVPAGPQEVSYRLLLKEVPPALTASTQGVKISLNISLPVFVGPAMPAGGAPVLRWQARLVDGGLLLRADNDGPLHVQVTGLRLAGGEPLPQFVTGYVLPGAYREWKVRHDAAAGSLLPLIANTDAGELVTQVPVAAP